MHVDKNPLTKEMIIEMVDSNFLFGSHTMDHINLNIDNENILKYQLSDSKKWIEDITKQDCKYFAWPYGTLKHINKDSLKYIKSYYPYIFSAIRDEKYYLEGGIINRDHFEGFWREADLKYFLSQKKLLK